MDLDHKSFAEGRSVRLAELMADNAMHRDIFRQSDVRARFQSVLDARGRQRVPAKAGRPF